MSTTVTTTLRNASLGDLVETLKSQQDLRFDHVATASRLSFKDGSLVIDGAGDKIITEAGVADGDAVLRPTDVFDSGIADRLGIPIKYLRRMRSEAIAGSFLDENPYANLLDANVNTWLNADPERKYLIRGFLSPEGGEGMARAFLSNGFAAYDNLDFLLAALAGAREAGVNLDVVGVDLSERRMRVKVACPEIAALAPILLNNYRSPFDDTTPERALALESHGWLRPDDRPTVFAGFVIGNSETGNGSWSITPQLTVLACRNGLTIKADALRGVHLGAKLDEGAVSWSGETQRRSAELISSQAADAVRSFCSKEYVDAKVAEMEVKAGVRVTNPTDTLERVAKQFGFSQSEQDLILADFISGGQSTAGGLMQAVTSAAQRVSDPDRAAEFEDAALDVLELAVKLAG